MRFYILPLLTLALALPVFAGDGVTEINNARAVTGGVTPSDTPGLPVTLDSPGSYVLTGNLGRSSSGGVIEITSDDVTLDLNGFSVRCTPNFPFSLCSTGIGIDAMNQNNVTVRNGTLAGFGEIGIRTLGEGNVIEHLRAFENQVHGIQVGAGSLVAHNVAHNNGLHGITAGEGVELVGNAVRGNGSLGIEAQTGCTIVNNTANRNGNDGIRGQNGVTIINNTAYLNGDATTPATDDGIQCGNGCTVRGNTVRSNSGVGLRLGPDSGYRENVISGNTAGTVSGNGVDAGANVINGVVTTTP